MRDADAHLFDLDETLVESIDAWIRADADAANHHGFVMTDQERRAVVHAPFGRILLERELPEDVIAAIMATRDLILPGYLKEEVRFRDGAEELLEHLRDHRGTAIITNSNDIAFRAMDERLGLRERVKTVFTWDDVGGRGKPDPLMVQKACDAFGVAPAKARVYGDTNNDKGAAEAAGTSFTLVRGRFTPEDLTHHDVVTSLRELTASLMQR